MGGGGASLAPPKSQNDNIMLHTLQKILFFNLYEKSMPLII